MKDRLTTAPQPLERPQCSCGTWNARSAIGTALRGLVKKHYYTRATHGIVEVMWSNRGAFVEKLSLAMLLSWGPRKSWIFGESRGLGRPLIKWSGISHCDPSAECECKFTTFF